MALLWATVLFTFASVAVAVEPASRRVRGSVAVPIAPAARARLALATFAAEPGPEAELLAAAAASPGPEHLPEQGYNGKDVRHTDGDTITSDWRQEYGPIRQSKGSSADAMSGAGGERSLPKSSAPAAVGVVSLIALAAPAVGLFINGF
eukprot:TRINITY_DN31319_c0_g1_i1.p3 TRINITY_DN31319_c0_g1~~TRINITY_DN31319_c0_g1_i1.p3  ORF type:complete len:149 (+),score=30.13 TRINITY_DN31319_c0_g1_i1:87-533(+)